jgi:hypothetical protein
MRRQISKSALVCLVGLFATAAAAQEKAADPNPLACGVYEPQPNSPALAKWTLRQRDDGADWTGPWTIEFKADGTWTQDGAKAGSWCQNGDTIIFGFPNSVRTTYRGAVGVTSIQGVESWDGGGTGIFEATR